MSATNALAIGETSIRQRDGLFSLNDLHLASGGEEKHRPTFFMRLDTTQALIEEISRCADSHIIPTKTVRGRGKEQGTYVCRELVYAYANWISPAFYLRMIRAFDALRGEPVFSQRQLAFSHRNPHLLPDAQAEEIKNRLGKLLALFHPFSDPYTDVLAVLRCLRGTHPLRGMPEPGFRQVMEAHRP